MPNNQNIGIPGTDSSAEVVHTIEGRTLIQLATDLFGVAPAFWGRYFETRGEQGGVHYHPGREHGPLRQNNIRVLPIAQQTERVNGSQLQGFDDAGSNIEAILAAFSIEYLGQLGPEFFVYLDVAGQPGRASATPWQCLILQVEL